MTPKEKAMQLIEDFEQLINQDLEKAVEDLKQFKQQTKELAVYNREQDQDFTTNYLESNAKETIFEVNSNPLISLHENSQN